MLWLKFRVSVNNLFESAQTIWRYYRNIRFARIDLYLLTLYFLNSPYKISKTHLERRRETDVYAYGETPLTTMDAIARAFSIEKGDHLYELGCGRGRGCFWLREFIGCRVTGVDFVPQFIEYANAVKSRFDVKGVTFLCEDMFEVNFEEGTVFYLYGTNLEDRQILRLIKKFLQLPKGTRIITVSFALNEYKEGAAFNVLGQIKTAFPWGEAVVYLQSL